MVTDIIWCGKTPIRQCARELLAEGGGVALAGVRLNAPQRSHGRIYRPVAAAPGSSIHPKGAYDMSFNIRRFGARAEVRPRLFPPDRRADRLVQFPVAALAYNRAMGAPPCRPHSAASRPCCRSTTSTHLTRAARVPAAAPRRASRGGRCLVSRSSSAGRKRIQRDQVVVRFWLHRCKVEGDAAVVPFRKRAWRTGAPAWSTGDGRAPAPHRPILSALVVVRQRRGRRCRPQLPLS